MLLAVFYLVQALRILASLVFLYQCGVFVFYFGRGLLKGENGITRGLMVLYIALLISGLSAMMDGTIFWLNFFSGSFGFLALPETHPTPYAMIFSVIRLVFILTACAGNHILYHALRKAR